MRRILVHLLEHPNTVNQIQSKIQVPNHVRVTTMAASRVYRFFIWRWDPYTGCPRSMYRKVITHSFWLEWDFELKFDMHIEKMSKICMRISCRNIPESRIWLPGMSSKGHQNNLYNWLVAHRLSQQSRRHNKSHCQTNNGTISVGEKHWEEHTPLSKLSSSSIQDNSELKSP